MKNNKDIFLALIDALAPAGPARQRMRAAFERQIPLMNRAKLDQTISDEEFRHALEKIKEEGSAFAAWLLNGSVRPGSGRHN